jgi:hypothetical protein
MSTFYPLEDGNSSVGIATVEVRFSEGASTESRRALGLTQPPIQWVPGALNLGVKRLGREADPTPPSSAVIKNGGAIPSFPHTSSWCSA